MQGLTAAEVLQARQEFGWNRLPPPPRPGPWRIFLRQLTHSMSLILLVAGALSLAIGAADEALMIGLVLLINASIGSYQELRAEKGAQALQQLLKVRARVIRDSVQQSVDAEELVPGDTVLLESGDRVPADLQLEWCQNLEVNESFLTGESLPVTKDALAEGDRLKAYAASTIVRGRGRGRVEHIGTQTAVGRLAHHVTQVRGGVSPLQVRMRRFTRMVAGVTAAIVFGVAALGVMVQGYSLQETFFFAVALAVSAIPEGLPIALTVALSVAASRMARRGAIVRRLEAVEALGSCTLIASDKTGTLTVNQLMAAELRTPDGVFFEVEGAGFEPVGNVLVRGIQPPSDWKPSVARVALLCNEAGLVKVEGRWEGVGDPLEVALLALGNKLGFLQEELLEAMPLVHALPFEAELKYSASFHRLGEQLWVGVKGAPEAILGRCPGSPEPWLKTADEMAGRGLRVLLLAEAGLAEGHFDAGHVELPPLTPLCLVGFVDPLRPEVPDAVARCRSAGIRVAMVTGDHPATALNIARQLGMAEHSGQVIRGDQLSDLTRQINDVCVFARTAPQQKLEIVRAAQASGQFVAVTGDGVNDAPALRAANIGVAMGLSGTDVAREASDLVLTDDNLATLVAGIEEGRIAYNNVRKVIFLLISTGLAEVLLLWVDYSPSHLSAP